MHTFTDTTGRQWTIAVNIHAIKRVRALIGVDLLTVVEGSLFTKLVDDPIFLCDLIYALVKPEADAQQVSDEAFGQAMAGDAIEHATVALLEELVGFFHGAKRRMLEKALRKIKTLEATAAELAEQRIDAVAIDPAVFDQTAPPPQAAGA